MFQQRVVLDTNVVLPALRFPRGSLAWFRHAWQTAAIRPLTSPDTVDELTRVLSYPKFELGDEERRELMQDYLPWCESVSVPESIAVPDCRDPSDRPFLMLALAAKADALITGDKDLLVLADDFPVPIIQPAEYARIHRQA